MLKTDVLVIGAGAVGCAITRELTKYNVSVICVDKREDIGGDASKSNSAIIHTGYDATPGTLESELVVAANPRYEKLCADLDIPLKKVGAIPMPFSTSTSAPAFAKTLLPKSALTVLIALTLSSSRSFLPLSLS